MHWVVGSDQVSSRVASHLVWGPTGPDASSYHEELFNFLLVKSTRSLEDTLAFLRHSFFNQISVRNCSDYVPDFTEKAGEYCRNMMQR